MSRSRRSSRPARGCGPRYCWCCDAKRCDRYVHDRYADEIDEYREEVVVERDGTSRLDYAFDVEASIK